MPLNKSAIAALIPHADAMCLLDEVTTWDTARVSALCRTHRNTNNPLRTEGGLFTLSAIEYAAQAMAVHGALVGAVSGRPRAGYLISLRNIVCGAPRLDALQGDLVVDAEQIMADGERVMYAFSLRVGDSQVVTGHATVMLDIEGGAR